jgi:hypothetical protein
MYASVGEGVGRKSAVSEIRTDLVDCIGCGGAAKIWGCSYGRFTGSVFGLDNISSARSQWPIEYNLRMFPRTPAALSFHSVHRWSLSFVLWNCIRLSVCTAHIDRLCL